MKVLVLLTGLLPASRVKNRLLSLAGGRRWHVARSAVIRPTVFWDVAAADIGEDVLIGTGNVFRDLEAITLGEAVEIGQLNWFTAVGRHIAVRLVEGAGSLVMDEMAAITSRHFLDCSGGISFRPMATMGGFRSMVLTRGADIKVVRQMLHPVVLERGSLLMAGGLVTPGSRLGEQVIVAAGSVVTGTLDTPSALYGGNPARLIKEVADAPFFERRTNRMFADPRRRRPPRLSPEHPQPPTGVAARRPAD